MTSEERAKTARRIFRQARWRASAAWRLARSFVGRHRIVASILALGLLLLAVARYEARSSWLQAGYFIGQAAQLTNELGEGPSNRIRFPNDGPYDRRLGYTRLPDALRSASGQGYRIEEQSRVSERFAEVVDRGISPIYREKEQAGLRILDRRGATVFESRYPERIYASHDSVAPSVWQTLLFLENRALLDPRFPNRNPSIDWSRMMRAAGDFVMSKMGSDRPVPGASTLATQIEKFWHSPDCRTHSIREKMLQMEAASLLLFENTRHTVVQRNSSGRTPPPFRIHAYSRWPYLGGRL